MRCIIQILNHGTIKINETTHEINKETLIIFTGIGISDTEETKRKAINFLSQSDFSDIYFLSNYTILGRLKGNKFTYHLNMTKQLAEVYFYQFVEEVREYFKDRNIKNGVFGGWIEIKGDLVGDSIVDF